MSGVRMAAVGAAALVLSIPVALVGRAAVATPSVVQRSLTAWPEDATLAAERLTLPERAAARLVGAHGAQRFADVVQTYRDAAREPVFDVAPDTLQDVLHRVPDLPTAETRAQGLVMLGVLFTFATGGSGRIEGGQAARRDNQFLLREAMDDFRTAIRTDGTNEEAKYDLEVLLRLQAAAAPQRRAGDADNERRARRPARRRPQALVLNRAEVNHAGVLVAGSGY
jgi:hypothetical protein